MMHVRIAIAIAIGMFGLIAMSAFASTSNLLSKFTRSDGAIVVAINSNSVDPYFANKALIIALEAGLDVKQITKAWLTWLVPRQRADGGFDRYCAREAVWHACNRADADDSSVASFLQLSALYAKAIMPSDKTGRKQLVSVANDGIPNLFTAEKKATQLLARLRTHRGTYRAFADESIEFLMDNTEVYAGLIATGKFSQAADLKRAIYKYFLIKQDWQPANVRYSQFDFYPSALAPTYLWHTNLVNSETVNKEFILWVQKWGKQWLTQSQDTFAWGLVAWGARHTTEQHWIRCWRHRYESYDRKVGWTVLDEAVDLGLAHLGVESVAISCATVLDEK